MVTIKNEQIDGIPVLHVVKKDLHYDKLPLVIFIHGFTSVKERNLHYAYMLAMSGFRVVLPEALYHGERDQSLDETELYSRFWEIVLTTIEEVNLLKEHYERQELIIPERIGVAGTSMGGIATLGALTQYPWIKAAVSLMGMPSYEKFSLWQLEQLQRHGVKLPFTDEQVKQQMSALRKYDLSLQPKKLNSRPLLFWHGEKDPMVPYKLTREFFEEVKHDYQDDHEKISFIADPAAGHNVSNEGVNAAVDWFKNHLLDAQNEQKIKNKVGAE